MLIQARSVILLFWVPLLTFQRLGLGLDKSTDQTKLNFSSWLLSTSSFYSLYIAIHSDLHWVQQITSLWLSQFSSARVCMIRKEPDHQLSRGQSVNSHASWTFYWNTTRFQMPLKANKVTHVSKLVWTIRSKIPRWISAVISYHELRVAAICDHVMFCVFHWAGAPLRNYERESPRHPHLLLTNQHKNADVNFIDLRSYIPEISWVRLQNCHPTVSEQDSSYPTNDWSSCYQKIVFLK